ncbi:hypothetical protein ONZ45_g2365 [Pleurotus djamor]|nr:hypothetical protein ONZ45_g2365 [Pleurotus djamor]
MPSIGPQIPPHLLNNHNDDDDDTGDTSIAPALVKAPADDDDSEDDYAPELPPGLGWFPGIEGDGPITETYCWTIYWTFTATQSSKPKALKRDEWMLVPPSSSDLLANLDPTKLSKGRQFSRSAAPPRQTDNSLWTETPAERQQRLADEVSGKKRRAVNADNSRSAEEELELRKRQRLDDEIRSGVEAHSRNVRGAALVDRHAKNIKDEEDPNANAIWDHGRDMGLGGRLMDDASRAKMLKDAKSLGDRFGSGSKGGFL